MGLGPRSHFFRLSQIIEWKEVNSAKDKRELIRMETCWYRHRYLRWVVGDPSSGTCRGNSCDIKGPVCSGKIPLRSTIQEAKSEKSSYPFSTTPSPTFSTSSLPSPRPVFSARSCLYVLSIWGPYIFSEISLQSYKPKIPEKRKETIKEKWIWGIEKERKEKQLWQTLTCEYYKPSCGIFFLWHS